MTFTTRSGSHYEVDPDGKRIRRLGGSLEPTPRQGIDGRWRDYVGLTPIEEGKPVLVVWEFGTAPGGLDKGTLTSPVAEVAP